MANYLDYQIMRREVKQVITGKLSGFTLRTILINKSSQSFDYHHSDNEVGDLTLRATIDNFFIATVTKFKGYQSPIRTFVFEPRELNLVQNMSTVLPPGQGRW